MDICRKLYDLCKLDTVIVLLPSDTLYLSGYSSTNCQIILTKSKSYFLTDMRYYLEAKASIGDRFEVISGSLEDNKNLIEGSYIGFEKGISYTEYLYLKQICGEKHLSDVSEQISGLRDIKSQDEIDKIICAQKVTELAFNEALDFVKEGISEYELAAYIEYVMLKNGCALAFDSIVAFGEHTASPHAHRSDKKLAVGDFITMDIGAKYCGYCSDMTRTVCFGNPSSEQTEIYQAVLNAQLKALDNIKAGMTGREGDAIARDYFASLKLDKYFTHSLGHGIGIDIHEGTGMTPRENRVLKKGMIVSVEPGLYLNSKFGVRIEDMALIEENSVKSLTNANKQLIIL